MYMYTYTPTYIHTYIRMYQDQQQPGLRRVKIEELLE